MWGVRFTVPTDKTLALSGNEPLSSLSAEGAIATVYRGVRLFRHTTGGAVAGAVISVSVVISVRMVRTDNHDTYGFPAMDRIRRRI